MFHVKHPPLVIQMKKGRGVYILKTMSHLSFNGDIRLARVEVVMRMIRSMTLAEMKAVVRQATQYHDSIVMALDPKWIKPEQ